MIHYLLEFSADGRRVTVYRDDLGAYIVERYVGEDRLVLANCDEFPDALAVFRNHRNDLETRVLAQELGA